MRMKRRIFTWFTFIVMLFVASFQEAKAVAITFEGDTKFNLDYGAVLVLEAGTYWDMDNSEGMGYSNRRPMHIEMPLGFRLKSFTLNGRNYVNARDDQKLDPLYMPDWVRDEKRYDIEAEIVPDIITSPEMLVSILNAYEPESAVLVDGNRVLLNKTVDYTEKEYPHIFDLGEDTLIIDANYTYNAAPQYMYLPQMQINSGNIVITNTLMSSRNNQDPVIVQKGGILRAINSILYGSFIEQEGGLFQIENSKISFNDEEDENKGPICIKGEEAKTELINGQISGIGNIIVESGELNIKNGVVDASILMKGGSLNVSGGYFYNSIFVASDDCNISFSGGNPIFKKSRINLHYHKGMTVPSSSSFLVDGYVFADNYKEMVFPLGKELVIENFRLGGEDYIGYSFSSVVSESYITKETMAYQAAKRADVGLNGKDVKINGTTYEIYTPDGLAWLAIMTDYDSNRRLENGLEYQPNDGKQYIFKLMNDLDMTGYGEDWPSIFINTDCIFTCIKLPCCRKIH